jgi:hypothetical protein
MSAFAAGLLSGVGTTLVGFVCATWLWWSRVRSPRVAEGEYKASQAAHVLHQLQELAVRAAFDIDEHSSQVEEINDTLTDGRKHPAPMILNAIAQLVQANTQMQSKLAATEDKLREQAQEVQNYATEARTDALTLLSNRRAFDDELARRMAEFARHGRGLLGHHRRRRSFQVLQ